MYLSPVRKLSPSRFNNYQEERESFTVDHFDWREKQVIGEIRNQQRVCVMGTDDRGLFIRRFSGEVVLSRVIGK